VALQKVRKKVRERDGGRCQRCGRTEAECGKLEVHRLDPKQKVHTVEGSALRCRACHKLEPKAPHGTRLTLRLDEDMIAPLKVRAKVANRTRREEALAILRAVLLGNDRKAN
jgi:5-methylcytosine-specific restriction endonuclease McrA